jgi:hypothetical protein
LDRGLVPRNLEGLFAKCTKTDVDATMSHRCFECCGACRIEWVLNNPDVLHRLFIKASEDGMLRQMEPAEIKYQCSFYVGDVILFVRPTSQEATTVRAILQIFGRASGLHTNLAKCSITPIFVVRTRSQTSSAFWAAKFRTSQSGTWACRLPQRRFRRQDSNPWCSHPQTATKPD